MEHARPGSGDELLRHQEFVRRLALELVRDAARADDLVQDAWLQALQRPPRAVAAARAWFRAVLRNLAVRGAREQGRRERRERSAARAEAQPSPLEIGERLALEQGLVRAVDALREPYRSAVFLRYFEDLSPRAIAAREGVPVATVKTRLRRALELLREALQRTHGPRGWALALVRLARPEHVAFPLAVPLAAATLALAGGALWLLRDDPRPRGRAEVALAAFVPPVSAGRALPAVALIPFDVLGEASRVTLPEAEASREPVGAEPVGRASTATVAEREREPALVLRGRVLFPDRTGVPDAGVVLGPYSSRTDARGRFEIALDHAAANRKITSLSGNDDRIRRDTALVACLDGWIPAVLADAGARVEAARGAGSFDLAPVELVLGGIALEIRGTVLERTGAAAEGWRIALLDGTPAFGGDYRPFTVEELASGTTTHVETDGDGGFGFRGLTPERSYRVRAWNEHTLEQIASEPIPAGTRGIVLRATADGWRPIVDGVVVALDGTPLEGLRCRLSMDEYRSGGGSWMTTGQEVKTDAQGRFVFHDVPPAEVFLRIDGQGCGVRIDLAPDEECRNRRIEVATSGEFILEVTGSARGAFAVCVLDDAGKRLELERQVAEGLTYSSTELTLSADGTCRARVSELARWLVLLDDGREIARLPLHVRHGAEARVRW